MQDPNEDTEWNDVLRAKGIIPEKPKEKEVTEDDIVSMLEKTIKEKSGGNNPYKVPYHSHQLCIINSVNSLLQCFIINNFPHYFHATAKDMEDMTLDELDELEDDEEERVLEQYRQQRIAQIKSLQEKSRY